MKKIFVLLPLMGCFFLVGCDSLEKDVVGVWEDDGCMSQIKEDQFSLNENKTVEGVEGYDEYEIEKVDDQDYDYLLLHGEIEDTLRLKVKMDEEDTLTLDDKGSAFGCTTKRVDG